MCAHTEQAAARVLVGGHQAFPVGLIFAPLRVSDRSDGISNVHGLTGVLAGPCKRRP